MPLPRISVVLAVKDRSQLLREALGSLTRQTMPDWETIIVDDGSTEDIAAAVAGLNDPRLLYFRNAGTPGLSGARNFGNAQARADWIAVADSDDINLPRRLAATLAYAQEHPDAQVICANMYCFRDGNPDILHWRGCRPYDRDLLYETCFIAHPASAYRRDLVLPIGYDESLNSAVDYDLWLSFSDQHARFGYIDEPLVLYRLHADQISTSPERKARQAANASLVRAKHAPFR